MKRADSTAIRARAASVFVTGLMLAALVSPAGASEDPLSFVAFVEEATGTCVNRNAVQILVRSTHPSRKLRVWLDRYVMGTGTGDRSRSDLLPGGAPEPLGCSRNLNGVQEWRPVRAMFLD